MVDGQVVFKAWLLASFKCDLAVFGFFGSGTSRAVYLGCKFSPVAPSV